MPNPRILVLYAHPAPHRSRINSRLAEAARALEGVLVHDLYETYPDFFIDVRREQALLEQVESFFQFGLAGRIHFVKVTHGATVLRQASDDGPPLFVFLAVNVERVAKYETVFDTERGRDAVGFESVQDGSAGKFGGRAFI